MIRQIKDSDLKAIANAIRKKLGNTEGFSISQMPEKISLIKTGGGKGEPFTVTLPIDFLTTIAVAEVTEET